MKIKDHTIFRTFFSLCLFVHNKAKCIMQIYNRYFQFITYVGRCSRENKYFVCIWKAHQLLTQLHLGPVNRCFGGVGGGGSEGKLAKGRI